MGRSETEKTAVVLLSGFLGAGKTTLLKRILSWESDLSDTVVVVNEFGEVGIDGALLKDAGTDVIEMTSGCICCTLSADLKRSLGRIQDRFEPRRIIIESTGVADPTAVVSVLKEPALAEKMALKKIVTVLDADFWEARENFGPLFYNQLDAASLILLNKVDLPGKERIPAYLKEIHAVIPDTQVVPTVHCRIDPETLWSVAEPKNFGIKPIQFYQPADHWGSGPSRKNEGKPVDASSYVTFSYQSRDVIDASRFSHFIENLPWEVFRVKGPVRFSGRTEILNFVGGKYDWSPWDGPPQTRLAFIGWNVAEAEILEKIQRCRA